MQLAHNYRLPSSKVKFQPQSKHISALRLREMAVLDQNTALKLERIVVHYLTGKSHL